MQTSDSPAYEIVCATQNIGFKKPADRRWIKVSYPISSDNYIKHLCKCITKNKANKKYNGIEVLLKPYQYAVGTSKKNIYYIGQCSRCETVYWNIT